MDLQLTRIVAAMDPRSRTFSAIVEIPNPDYSLRTGLYAEVTLSPRDAVQTSLDTTVKTKKAIRAKKD
jgi:multidrug efflux pump subunit AcrA (membrane-fusion protein)